MATAITYCSFVESSGYGHAGVGYVRALVNAGVPVHWVALRHDRNTVVRCPPGDTLPLVVLARDDESLADLPALIAATARPIATDTLVAHTVPEHWPQLFETRKRNIGCTVWETDRAPAHWRPLFDRADRIVVPCEMNRATFEASGTPTPVRVVPHVRRHAWNHFTPSDLAAARDRHGVAAARFIFLSISTWDPRKAVPGLLRAFVRAFRDDEGVALVLKTAPIGFGPPPHYERASTLELAQAAVDAETDALDRDAPPIAVLPFEAGGREIDLLHELADAYVTLPHGEGWALGAFDAAARGTPVIATGWSGHLDWLGAGWPGAVGHRLVGAPAWPPDRPSYWPSQRWAEPDLDHAAMLMREHVRDPARFRATAATIAERIADDYTEPRIARAFLAALAD